MITHIPAPIFDNRSEGQPRRESSDNVTSGKTSEPRRQPIAGVSFHPPADLVLEEVSATYRAPAADVSLRPTLSRVLQVRPTFVAQRRSVAAGSRIEDLAAATKAQLFKSIQNIGPIAERGFPFQDGAQGVLLQYSVAALPDLHLMHLLALRLDGTILCTFSIASAEELFSKELREAYESSLASASVEDRTRESTETSRSES